MPDIIVMQGDMKSICTEIPDSSIDLIFTDPPYPKEFLHLYDTLGEVAYRVLKPGGYLITYTGQYHLPAVMSRIGSRGLEYFWCCANLHAGTTRIIRQRGAQNGWKPILIFSKGKPGDHRVFYDKYTSKRSKIFHEWGQDEETAAYYISCFSNPGDTILDPFCGGGTTAYACAQTERSCITIDIDPQAVEVARHRIELVQKRLIPEMELQSELWTPTYSIPLSVDPDDYPVV